MSQSHWHVSQKTIGPFLNIEISKLLKKFVKLRRSRQKSSSTTDSFLTKTTPMFWLLFGLLSGSLFVISIDPLLFQFRKHVMDPQLGQVRACADDIGAALRALGSLPVLCKLFAQFRKVSGLSLKASKCVIVLSTVCVSDNNKLRVKEWLRSFCPEWSDFVIKDAGKYLGLYLGPGAGALPAGHQPSLGGAG